jgi:hypothetical protein
MKPRGTRTALLVGEQGRRTPNSTISLDALPESQVRGLPWEKDGLANARTIAGT